MSQLIKVTIEKTVTCEVYVQSPLKNRRITGEEIIKAAKDQNVSLDWDAFDADYDVTFDGKPLPADEAAKINAWDVLEL